MERDGEDAAALQPLVDKAPETLQVGPEQTSLELSGANNNALPMEIVGSLPQNADQMAQSSAKAHGNVINNAASDVHYLDSAAKLNQCSFPSSLQNLAFPNQGRHTNAQTPLGDPSRYSASGHNHNTSWLPFPDSGMNNSMHLGYHKESNERTKMFPDNHHWQTPASLIEQYKLPLSQTSATSIVSPQPIIQTPTSNNVLSLPPYSSQGFLYPPASSHPSISHVFASRGDQLQHIGQQVNSTFIHQPTPSAKLPAIKSAPDSARQFQPKHIKDRRLQRHSGAEASASRNRPRAVNQRQAITGLKAGRTTSRRMVLTPGDLNLIQLLREAMNDMRNSEDNDGMIKSWDKMRGLKRNRIESVCKELLFMTKRASELNGGPLCDRKRSSNTYPTFGSRFNALCRTLKVSSERLAFRGETDAFLDSKNSVQTLDGGPLPISGG